MNIETEEARQDSEARLAWNTPGLRKLDAAEAEIGINPSTDGNLFS
ncbi:MAG: hypothetical protein WDN03_03545 [Rhizomicrobium sp.]